MRQHLSRGTCATFTTSRIASRLRASDVIVTDPPYEVAALSVWRSLATFAGHALRPGGCSSPCQARSRAGRLPRAWSTMRGLLRSSPLTLCYNMQRDQLECRPGCCVIGNPCSSTQRADGIAPHFLDDLITAPVRAEQDDAHHKWGPARGGHGRTCSARSSAR